MPDAHSTQSPAQQIGTSEEKPRGGVAKLIHMDQFRKPHCDSFNFYFSLANPQFALRVGSTRLRRKCVF